MNEDRPTPHPRKLSKSPRRFNVRGRQKSRRAGEAGEKKTTSNLTFGRTIVLIPEAMVIEQIALIALGIIANGLTFVLGFMAGRVSRKESPQKIEYR